MDPGDIIPGLTLILRVQQPLRLDPFFVYSDRCLWSWLGLNAIFLRLLGAAHFVVLLQSRVAESEVLAKGKLRLINIRCKPSACAVGCDFHE